MEINLTFHCAVFPDYVVIPNFNGRVHIWVEAQIRRAGSCVKPGARGDGQSRYEAGWPEFRLAPLTQLLLAAVMPCC